MHLLPLLLAASAALAPAVEQHALVAVLPLATRDELRPAEREALEESLRTSAGDVLTPRGYTVLTGDTTLQLLADNGVDAQNACEASCALAAARELKARLFASGSIARIDGTWLVFVRLFESEAGRQVASIKLQADTILGLVGQLDTRAPELFGKAPSLARPAARSTTIAASTAPPAARPAAPPSTTPASPGEERDTLGPLRVRAGIGIGTAVGLGLDLRLGAVTLSGGAGFPGPSVGIGLGGARTRGGFFASAGYLVDVASRGAPWHLFAATGGYEWLLTPRWVFRLGLGVALVLESDFEPEVVVPFPELALAVRF